MSAVYCSSYLIITVKPRLQHAEQNNGSYAKSAALQNYPSCLPEAALHAMPDELDHRSICFQPASLSAQLVGLDNEQSLVAVAHSQIERGNNKTAYILYVYRQARGQSSQQSPIFAAQPGTLDQPTLSSSQELVNRAVVLTRQPTMCSLICSHSNKSLHKSAFSCVYQNGGQTLSASKTVTQVFDI